MVELGPCIVLSQANSVCVIQVITWIHVKSLEKTQIEMICEAPFAYNVYTTWVRIGVRPVPHLVAGDCPQLPGLFPDRKLVAKGMYLDPTIPIWIGWANI